MSEEQKETEQINSLEHTEEVEKIPKDFFYERKELRKRRLDNELPRDKAILLHSLGQDSRQRNNIFYIDDTTLVYAVGNVVVLLGEISYNFYLF